MSFVTTWIELEGIILIEINQKEKILNIFTYRRKIKKLEKGSEKNQNLQANYVSVACSSKSEGRRGFKTGEIRAQGTTATNDE